MRWKGIEVLVTGAGGFIGSHLVERLLVAGARVRALVRYNSMNDWHLLREIPAELLSRATVLEGDVRDPFFVRRACDGTDTVFHLAATISIPHSYQAPIDFVDTNVLGTANILSAAVECRCRRVICTSTSEVYGTAVTRPMDENHRLHPQSPYAASKVGADMLALSYYYSFDAPVIVVRPFNTYGPRQSARAIIPTILSQLIGGATVRIGDVSTKRDFTCVFDTVEGFLAAAGSPDGVGHVINLGSQRPVSIKQLIGLAGKVVGRKPRIVMDRQRIRPDKSEVKVLHADAGRARALLGWESRIPLEDGLKQTYDYIKSRVDRYRPGEYLR